MTAALAMFALANGAASALFVAVATDHGKPMSQGAALMAGLTGFAGVFAAVALVWMLAGARL